MSQEILIGFAWLSVALASSFFIICAGIAVYRVGL